MRIKGIRAFQNQKKKVKEHRSGSRVQYDEGILVRVASGQARINNLGPSSQGEECYSVYLVVYDLCHVDCSTRPILLDILRTYLH